MGDAGGPGRTGKEPDVLENVTWFRQSSMRLATESRTIYVDPWGTAEGDPKADLILITHAHFDHLQPGEIQRLSDANTKLVAPKDVANELSGDSTPVSPGESHEVAGVRFETVPAYNVAPDRLDMHPKSNDWVGYVMEFDGRRFYHAGDTDALPELESLQTDVAMVPIGGTYTMDYREAAAFVKAMEPGLAVPMHFGFVVCSPSHGDLFRKEAQPISVEVLEPMNQYEQT
jgi:L-ascorbate metabolism protein UlaG (beta-lactamase superfamily)